MDDRHRRELVNRLFATALAQLEDATAIATAGQSARSSLRLLGRNAAALRSAAREIVAVAAAVIAQPGATARVPWRRP